MSALYIHIPFCKQKCNYCNFHFSTLLKQKEQMLQAIAHEMFLRQAEIQSPLESVYFGGGTPSILNLDEIYFLFNKIKAFFEIKPDAEITLEANPDDLTLEKIQALVQTPMNRLSIGIQSFFDADLQFMNRAHNAHQAESCIKNAQKYGFDNLSIDLIYGTPTTSDAMWQENVNKAISLGVPHISAYALTVEPNTALNHKIQKGTLPNVDEQKQQAQYLTMIELLGQNAYEQYEISNFAKNQQYAKHNSSYWLGKKYLGIGPSAHSFDGKSRAWNVANNSKYIAQIGENKLPQEREVLSPKDRLNELTMIGLRTIFGIDLGKIQSEFSADLWQKWWAQAEIFVQEGKLILRGNKIFLAPAYRFFADGIASELFIL
ncbi:radical SAM family heme chaperone HemW [Ornithobacterium rhinotracheale]|uniref:radical SAM family heme chaperone HemW n=1 Tax=Ornithobacterium rhinotracheale TaxID=28251 RepID=UPI001FB9B053|nr:radical SAM family heme chaperone HemW [Ornithobacterium rhinotracheale]MRJ07446.1 radical SAM family heme chaperone HemW [Ornithobacterium rhinotracheale]UOH78043.1 radical SAM family heme chaperone HemW [Ornithobacterium rhinotracheale]